MAASPRLRESLAAAPPATGKAGPAAVAEPRHQLALNESPYPPLPSVVRTVAEEAARLNRYPDRYCVELVAAIAKRYGVPEEHVATGTGSNGVAMQYVQVTAGPGDEVLYAWRSYEVYPIVVHVCGARSVQVPLADERHDLDAMAGAVTERTRLVFVCNPNNPTGTVLRRAELERFCDRVPSDVLIVFDEAYGEFLRDPDVPDAVELYRERPNVAIMRTFSKAYGLAGLRVGYAIAHEPVADALRRTGVPFGVSGVAQAAALASLRAEPELLARVDDLVRERERVLAGLREAGWDVPESQANFVWLPLGERAAELGELAGAMGVAVRTFPGEGVRVTLGSAEANDAFLEVARQFPR